jgi:hypothetical protein
MMNKSLILTPLVVFSIAIATNLATRNNSMESLSGIRLPSSLLDLNNEQKSSDSPSGAKEEMASKKLHRHLSVHQKVRPPISIKIDKKSVGFIEVQQEFELIAEVQSKTPADSVQVDWKIPEGVEVIGGEVHHLISNLKANEIRSIRITLRSLTSENLQIHVVATALYGRQALVSGDQFNTVDEQDIEKEKAALVERHLRYVDP